MTDHKTLTEALIAFQAELPDVSKGGTNPAFKSREEWRPVANDPRYEVSSMGRARVKPRTIVRSNGTTQRLPGRMLKGRSTAGGYRLLALGRRRSEYMHTLVLQAFVGPRPNGEEACHNNGIRDDNRVDNLRWGTRSENAQDTLRHGHNDRRNRTHCPRGHRLEPPNLVACDAEKGYRSCLACNRARAAAARVDDWVAESHRRYARIMGAA